MVFNVSIGLPINNIMIYFDFVADNITDRKFTLSVRIFPYYEQTKITVADSEQKSTTGTNCI